MCINESGHINELKEEIKYILVDISNKILLI